MRRLLVDTAVLAYAVGDEHPQRSACRRLVRAATEGQVEFHASVELVQEFLFHRLRRVARAEAVAQARDVADLCVLHSVDRDAVHAATALIHGFPAIVSPDRDFDFVVGLERIDPAAAT